MTITFGQGECATSSETPLFSDRHDNCHAVIVYNTDKREALMLHVWEGAWNGLSAEQVSAAEQFMAKPGRKIAVRIVGSYSILHDQAPEHSAKSQLQKMGLDFTDDVDVRTGEDKWSARFDPKECELVVATDEGKVLHQDKLFKHVVNTCSGSNLETPIYLS